MWVSLWDPHLSSEGGPQPLSTLLRQLTKRWPCLCGISIHFCESSEHCWALPSYWNRVAKQTTTWESIYLYRSYKHSGTLLPYTQPPLCSVLSKCSVQWPSHQGGWGSGDLNSGYRGPRGRYHIHQTFMAFLADIKYMSQIGILLQVQIHTFLPPCGSILSLKGTYYFGKLVAFYTQPSSVRIHIKSTRRFLNRYTTHLVLGGLLPPWFSKQQGCPHPYPHWSLYVRSLSQW